MTQAKTSDISEVKFSSTVCPSPEDKALWSHLSADQRRTLVVDSEQAAFEGGVSESTSLSELLNETRAER
ncbi:hypothetical protein [uncultured Nisaea sp.]|uniref:hypothetical protein n=1 Tax=uncultured Nisaea sp. TaxID=538215 RepID=UPI0030EEB96A|tara:strand:+ start:2580 stop:2789 length:210 start_codon:yes stop_codon:yes gene_type:complete